MIKFLFASLLAFTFIFSFNGYAEDSSSEELSNLKEKKGLSSWESYYQNTLNAKDPHKTLSLAQKYFQIENTNTGQAVDLGAGTGRDTLFLLKAGWQVLALDAEQLSIDIILQRVEDNNSSNLKVAVSPFSEMIIPNEVNLVNASFSLPFCKPEEFDACWEKVVNSLAVGGRFSGQFFGKNDEWASNPNLTIHTYDDIIKLFKTQFNIRLLA